MILNLAQVIKNYLQLTDDQIYIDNQNYKLTNIDKLTVILQQGAVTVRGNNKKVLNDGTEEITVYYSETISINLLSGNSEAREKQFDVIAALNSQVAEYSQRANGYKIFKIPNSMINVSAVEAGNVLNRFVIDVVIYTARSSINSVQYYDDFSNRQTLTIEK